MKIVIFTSVIISSFLFTYNYTYASISSLVWEEISTLEGITISKTLNRQGIDSRIVGFKGETLINASSEKVLGILLDNEHKKEWVDRLVKNEVLETFNTYEFLMYQEFHLPWPLANRDFVYRAKVIRLNATTILISLKSEETFKAPKTVGVRAELIDGQYILKSVDAHTTLLMVEIISDPKGLIPLWLVNLIQRKWPYKTLMAIKEQVKKDIFKSLDLPL